MTAREPMGTTHKRDLGKDPMGTTHRRDLGKDPMGRRGTKTFLELIHIKQGK